MVKTAPFVNPPPATDRDTPSAAALSPPVPPVATAPVCPAPRADRREWLLLAVVLAAFVAVRAMDIGHLLTFDEAWDEQALRAAARGETNDLTHNLVRHPPLYLFLGRLATAWTTDTATGLEWLSLGLHALGLIVLFRVVRRTAGREAAWWSLAAYLLMPGAQLFDTWIKRDPAANLGGLLGVLAFVAGRPGLAGLAIGLALLGKETAVFYAQALVWVALLGPSPKQRLASLARTAAVAGLVCGWWYAFVWQGGGHFLGFFLGRTTENARFAEPVWFYLGKMPDLLGRTATLLALAGLAAGGLAAYRDRAAAGRHLLPALLVVPPLLLLTLSRGKPLWLIIPLLPGLAMLTGTGAAAARRTAVTHLRRCLPARLATGQLPALVAAAIVVAILWPLPPWRPYEGRLREHLPRLWAGALMSRQCALTVNRLTAPGDRLLLTTFSYLSDETRFCPVFLHYLHPRDAVVRPYRTPTAELLALIPQYGLDWALLSPGPNPAQTDMAREFARRTGERPVRMYGAVLFRVGALKSPAPPAATVPRGR